MEHIDYDEILSFPDRVKFIKDKGWEISSLRERILFDVILLFNFGTCPDHSESINYTYCSDTVNLNRDLPVIVGNYSSGKGLHVRTLSLQHVGYIGMIPTIPITD